MIRRDTMYERRLFQNPLDNMDIVDCTSFAFYIFELTKKTKDSSLIGTRSCKQVITSLAKNLNLLPRLELILDSYVNKHIADGKFHLIENEPEQEPPRRRTAHYYCEDSLLYKEDRRIMREMDSASDSEMKYYRAINAEETGTLSQIIYHTFFSTAKRPNLSVFHDQVPAKIKKQAKDLSKVKFLINDLGLTETEAAYILLRYRKAVFEGFDELCNTLTGNSSELYTKLLGVSNNEFSKIHRSNQKLRQYNFINEQRMFNPSLIEVIENQDLNLYFSDFIKTIELKDTYKLKSFSVPEENTLIYKNMLKSDSAISILLYGKPGSGKTEYAKALIKSTGKKAMIFKNEAEIEDKKSILGKLTCLLSIKKQDTVLIIDEADSLLATISMSPFGAITSTEKKGAINRMLDDSNNKVIWIVNYKSQIDSSTLRRFTASYRFEAMSQKMLEEIAYNKLSSVEVKNETKQDILKLFSQYNVTGASVDNMIKTIKSINHKDDSSLLKEVEIVIKDNSTLLNGNSKMRETVNSSYEPSVLNTSISADKLVTMLKNAEDYAARKPGNGAIRMLFYGLSGTGKTEFARYISQILGKKILLKRASDIFDKYVGETEKRIAGAFQEAAANNMILLFDEADSFFADRNSAQRNYERTQVNEFLTQLEEFPGIVICTTNLRQIMDPAMLRRFHLTVDFKALTEDGIKTLLDSYFGEYQFTEEQVQELSDYETVTPGDFSRLSGTIRFMSPEEISGSMIIEELCNIQEEKKMNGSGFSSSRIGFLN